MDQWELIKTAYIVASHGTLSAAATHLGVHRATVLRHINALEDALGEPVFLRHPRGYTPTEAGEDLMRVAKITDEHFTDLFARIQSKSSRITGELIITSVSGISTTFMPAIAEYQQTHHVQVSYLTTNRTLRLEYGEAHVALRVGEKIDVRDYKVLPLTPLRMRLYASQSYLERAGHPSSIDDLDAHTLVQRAGSIHTPFERWLEHATPHAGCALQANDPNVFHQAIASGMGIGFMSSHTVELYKGLVDVFPNEHITEWSLPMWLLSHNDLYETYKVQAFLDVLDKYNLCSPHDTNTQHT